MKTFSLKNQKIGLGIVSLVALLALPFAHGKEANIHKTAFRFSGKDTLENYKMSATTSAPELVDVTYSASGDTVIDRIDANTWAGKTGKHFDATKRYEYLWNAYVADDIHNKEPRERRTICFLGDPVLFVNGFLNPKIDLGTIDNSAGISVHMSSDRFLLGIAGKFTPTQKDAIAFNFGLPSCEMPGKNDLVPGLAAANSRLPASNLKIVPFTASEKADLKEMLAAKIQNRIPQANASQGFGMADTFTPPTGLRSYIVSADYEQAKTRWNDHNDRPWKGLRLDTPDGQLAFSRMMRDYAYDGMVNNGGSPESILYPEKNTKRYWCNMPWLNVGDNGRDAIHGLTKERPLSASPIYPTPAGSDPKFPLGADWGIGFYNAPGCLGIQRVFGSKNSPVYPPKYIPTNWNGNMAYFPDGTVAVKFLFTSAGSQTDKPFPALDGTHILQAHASHISQDPTTKKLIDLPRTMMGVRLVQIDVAVKDSTLVGARKDLDYWVMTTYYFDKTFKSDTKNYWATKVPNVPEGFLNMRPQGVQLGLGKPDSGHPDSSVFAGSNQNGLDGRLNGPADNPKGSCLGCHATAGQVNTVDPKLPSAIVVPMVPGYLSDEDYAKATTASPNLTLDFSQQLALAKRNQQAIEAGLPPPK
jgi:hypothetical protein